MKVLLIDTSYLIYRSYFAFPNLTHNDQPVGAFFGFAKGVLSLVKEYQPDELVFACDTPDPTWRHQMYDGYKAGRTAIEPNMVAQFPIIKQFAQSITQNYYEQAGWEADDFIHTIAKEANADSQIMVFSADKDLYQLFQYPNTEMIHAKKFGGFETFTRENFIAKYELQPLQWIDYKSLVGDNSDNLPGIPGIGPKTATKILKEVGCIANLTEALNLGPFDFNHVEGDHNTQKFISNEKNFSLIEKIVTNLESLQQTYKLAGLSTIPETKFSKTGFNIHNSLDLVEEYGFKSIATMINKLNQKPQDKPEKVQLEPELKPENSPKDDGALF